MNYLVYYKKSSHAVYAETLVQLIRSEKDSKVTEIEENSISNFHKEPAAIRFLLFFKFFINFLFIEDYIYAKDWKRKSIALGPMLELLRMIGVGKSRVFRKICTRGYRLLSSRIPTQLKFDEIIQKYKPDVIVVFPTNWVNSSEFGLLRSAKKFGVMTVLPIMSVDNVFSKGILLEPVDLIGAWNSHQRDYLVKYHNISNKRIQIVGSLFFERWSTSLTKCVKPNPKGNLNVLYLGSSPRIALFRGENARSAIGMEIAAVSKIASNLQFYAAKFGVKINFNIRLHPNVPNIDMDFSAYKNLDINYSQANDSFSDIETTAFLNQLALSDIIVGLNTSAMIQSVLHGANCYYLDESEFSRITTETLHLKSVINSGILTPFSFLELQSYKVRNHDFKQAQSAARRYTGLDQGKTPSLTLLNFIKSNFL